MGFPFLRFFSSMGFVLWFCFIHLAVVHVASLMQPLCHDGDRSALLQFTQSLRISRPEFSKVASWKLEEDCCSWKGVTCNNNTGRITRLNLSNAYLSGSLNSNSTLFHLVHLRRLNLADNAFYDSKIPAAIKNFSRLEHLNLAFCDLSGQIPSELLDLSRLVSLDLADNNPYAKSFQLRNPGLRSLVEKLTNLKVLNLRSVFIASSVPHSLANLSSLTYLCLDDCALQGAFPSQIFQLPNLSFLSVSSNVNLTGYIPEFERSNSLTSLEISGCNFSGTIPSSIGNLTKLVSLAISFNSFSGEFPFSIGNLASLKELFVTGCNLSGPIPSSLGNLTQLTSLYMGQNQLTGPIPSSLIRNSLLSFLSLESNQITSQIPPEIRNLTQLIFLDLSSNSLEGPIPTTIFELKNLGSLRLQSNKLNGTVDLDMLQPLEELMLSSNNLSVLSNTNVNTSLETLAFLGLSSCNLTKFPNFLQNHKLLFVLDLSSNKISGQIPKWFFDPRIMVGLENLNLSNNLLTGFEQHPIVFTSNLVSLDLRFNKLQGLLPIPPPFTNHYLISNNMLNGGIPPHICNLKGLQTLDLSNNNLSGVIPQCLGNFSSDLSILALQSNKFHGSIPQMFMNGSNLRMIDLSNNSLEGRIPRSLVNCTQLEFLHLGSNQIRDIFPSWLGNLPELKVLILKSNRFHGVIKEPETNLEFSKLHVIDLSHNMFRGKLPTKYFQSWNAMKIVNEAKLKYMKNELQPFSPYVVGAFRELLDYAYSMKISNKGIELDYEKISNMFTAIILSGNKFEGEIPTSIASLIGLKSLNLSQNNLEGHIPSFFGNLTALESLDLSKNRLSGEIPQQLAKITYFAVFNVSHNHLTGPIPHGKQFDTFENSSYYGNPGLCGKPLSKMCEKFEPSKKEDEDVESPFTFDWKIVLIGFASGLIVGVVLGQEFYTKIGEWFVKTFGIQMKRKKGRRN